MLFLQAYLLTNLLEFLPLNYLSKKPLKQKIPALLFINLLTMPLVWFLISSFTPYLTVFLLAEALAILLETLLIKNLLKENLSLSFKISFYINVLSAGIGIIFF